MNSYAPDTLAPGLAPGPAPAAAPPKRGYLRLTRTGTYSFLAALPLIALYEGLIRLASGGQIVAVRVGADVWVKQFLAWLGAEGTLWLSGVLVLVGAAVMLFERRKRIPLRGAYFAGMVAESLVYAVVVALLVSSMVGFLFAGPMAALRPAIAAPDGLAGQGLLTQIALSIGAGIYEELVFRVFIVGGLYLLLALVLGNRGVAYVVAAVVGAAFFSAVHYMGSLGDVFTLPSFTFRLLFGLALNALFLARGFGVAAWTHALYDILIVTHLLG